MDVRERVSLMGMQIDRVTEIQAVDTIGRSMAEGQGGWVITPNLEHLRQFSKQKSLRPFFETADLVLADGMPLVWASRLAGTPLPARVAGSDLIWSLSCEAGRRGASIFVLGGTREAGWEAARKLKEECPGLRIAGMIYPPYGFEKDDGIGCIEHPRSTLRWRFPTSPTTRSATGPASRKTAGGSRTSFAATCRSSRCGQRRQGSCWAGC